MIPFLVASSGAAINVAFFVADTAYWWNAASAVICVLMAIFIALEMTAR